MEKEACKAWCLIILLSLVTSVWCKSLMNVDQNPFWFGAHYLFIHLDGFRKSGDTVHTHSRALSISHPKPIRYNVCVYNILYQNTQEIARHIGSVRPLDLLRQMNPNEKWPNEKQMQFIWWIIHSFSHSKPNQTIFPIAYFGPFLPLVLNANQWICATLCLCYCVQ